MTIGVRGGILRRVLKVYKTMDFKSVICRFVPLLDVVLMMLGALVVIITYTQVQHQVKERFAETTAQLEAPDQDPELVYQRVLANQLIRGLMLVYAETARGPNFDKCFLLDADGKPRKEIPLTASPHPSEVPELTPGMTVVVLISGAGFDSRWTRKRIENIEKTFEVRVVPLYNIDLRL